MGAPPAAALEIQGHRGARGLAPENTLAGFARALAIGVHTLELDVAMTRDRVVVVHHDPTLNPDTTRDPRGEWLAPGTRTPLYSLTLAELRALDVGAARPGSAHARRFPAQQPVHGQRIPTLEEVIALVSHPPTQRIRLNVEVKMRPLQPDLTPAPEEFADAVAALLLRARLEERAAVQSFDWRVPVRIQTATPRLRSGHLSAHHHGGDTVSARDGAPSPWTAGLCLDDFAGSVPDMVHAAGGGVWAPDHRDLVEGDLARARALGLRVVVWTVNSPRHIRRMIRLGVDGIISDYPDRVREIAQGLGLAVPDPVQVSP